MGKNRLHKRLENIAQKLGYKEIRYGIPYGIPFARICWKNRKNIKDLKSLVEDQKSLDVINAVIKSKISRNVNKYISRIYDEKEDIQTKDI
ncbi:MAG: hypothetical protein LBH34_03825, partial [Prevotellaceae bacterium]|nr:hypothetical protein [Prevotellaceae bacterium]